MQRNREKKEWVSRKREASSVTWEMSAHVASFSLCFSVTELRWVSVSIEQLAIQVMSVTVAYARTSLLVERMNVDDRFFVEEFLNGFETLRSYLFRCRSRFASPNFVTSSVRPIVNRIVTKILPLRAMHTMEVSVRWIRNSWPLSQKRRAVAVSSFYFSLKFVDFLS